MKMNIDAITVFNYFYNKKLQRYFLQLSFKGTPFNGWQKQQNAPSVQEAVEKGLSLILRNQIEIVGAGRTDTGVHARYYIAHFDSPKMIGHPSDFIYHLNQVLPYEISVQKIMPVIPEAHARFDAISRTYCYQITLVKDPFGNDLSYYLSIPPDFSALNNASAQLLNFKDFTSFCKLHSDNKTNICNIYEAYWQKLDDMLVFTIKADRFLRNMVRAIVGTVLEVGKGKLSVDDFKNIIASKDRSKASTSAPARGLHLINIQYNGNLFLP
jgi:tRNA pseudouridine38-40 synthase